MTKMLASVTGLAEAEIAIAGGADIVDLKDPKAGALGAVATETIRQVVTSVAGRCATSAVCGDLPMEPETIRAKAEEIAATGVDYVKIGFFPLRNAVACVEALAPLAARTKLIAVLFADQAPDFELLPVLAKHGFHGVMVDTADKSKGRLLDHLPPERIPDFVDARQGIRSRGGSERIARSARHSPAVAVRAGLSRFSRRALRPVAAHWLDRRASGRADPRADSRRAQEPALRERRLPPAGGARLFARHRRPGARDRQDLRARFRAAGADRRLQFRARPHAEGALRRDRRRAAGDQAARRTCAMCSPTTSSWTASAPSSRADMSS